MKFKPHSENKCWGKSLHIFSSEHAAVSCLELKADFRCSRHCHNERANLFALLEGCICIEQWDHGLKRPSTIRILRPGQIHTVHSSIYHRFRVISSGKLVEVYWPDEGGVVKIDDIVRHDEGGPDDFEDLKELLDQMP